MNQRAIPYKATDGVSICHSTGSQLSCASRSGGPDLKDGTRGRLNTRRVFLSAYLSKKDDRIHLPDRALHNSQFPLNFVAFFPDVKVNDELGVDRFGWVNGLGKCVGGEGGNEGS